MLKYFKELILGPEKVGDRLDEAYKVLAQAEEEEKPREEEFARDDLNPKYQITHKIGIITNSGNNIYEIDHKYKFLSETIFTLGTTVSFTIYKDGESNKICNVKEIADEWGVEAAQKGNGTWCLRTINAQVVSRSGRNLIVDPGNIEIDLNQTKSEFIPIVGDFLEVETKSEVDEKVLNLNGRILEIIKIRPVRATIKEGFIKTFNDKKYTGTVNRDIFFNKEALLNGYTPKVGDKVIVEIIESNQFKYFWRAVKVMLQSSAHTSNSNVFGNLKKLIAYEHSKDGVQISENVLIKAKNFNESHTVHMSITNDGCEKINLKNISIEGSLHQTILQGAKVKNQMISAGETVKFTFGVAVKCSGKSREIILFHFDDVIVGRVITINLEMCHLIQETSNSGCVSRNAPYDNMKRHMRKNYQQPVRGQPVRQCPRFYAKRVNDWSLPRDFMTMYFNFDDEIEQRQNIREELIKLKPFLTESLTLQNYADRFHTLIYLEELYHMQCIRKYDLERACFIVDGSYLILEMTGLAESRPSIIVGDKVIATCLETSVPYEGYVHKSMGNHLKLKFAVIFHQQYKGEDYAIHVQPSRASFRREHQATFLAVQEISDLLFPNQVLKKKPQVKFTFEHYEDIIPTSETKMRIHETPLAAIETPKRISKVELIRRMNMMNTKDSASNNVLDQEIALVNKENNETHLKPDETKLVLNHSQAHRPIPKKFQYKLEWFDKSLNYYQKEAVRNILVGESRPLPYIIFGPPGTGKTVTIVECILQILRLISHSRLLIATPSNSAANLLTTRLINSGSLQPGDLVRLVSFRAIEDNVIPPSIIPYCATASIAQEGTTAEENFITEKGFVTDMTMTAIGRHRVTIGTCHALGTLQQINFKKGHFTHIIVDEAGQCKESEIMIPLTQVDTSDGQIIMAGDPRQLGPVVISSVASQLGHSITYMDRLIHRFPYVRDVAGFANTGGYDPRLVTKLLYNYRALPELLTIPNSCFYDNELRATISENDSAEAQFLINLSDMLPTNGDRTPSLVFHGVDGINQRGDDVPSWYNVDEASQVFYYVNELYRLCVPAKDVGIITPYIKQVQQIRAVLREAEFDVPKVGTVEEFQGAEYKVIIISTVRSCSDDLVFDEKYVLGFIGNCRRFNVALTRSRCLTIVIGNPRLLQMDKHWSLVLAYCCKRNSYIGCDLK